jgi:hypothetical protein
VSSNHLPGLFIFQQQSQPQSHHLVMTPHHIGRHPLAGKQRKEKRKAHDE